MAAGQSRAAKKRAKQKQKEGGAKKQCKIETTTQQNNSGDAAAETTCLVHQQRNNHAENDVSNGKTIDEERTAATAKEERKVTRASESTEKNFADESKHFLLDLVASFEDQSNTEVEGDHDDGAETAPERARKILQFLLEDDLSAQAFYDEYWEKQPVHIASTRRDRFDGFLSLESLRRGTATTTTMTYGKDLNVTRYQLANGSTVKRRVTLDPVGTPVGAELWTKYFDGSHCTVRYLAPQKLSMHLHSLLSLLESEWGCMVGCNAYLTPAQSQQGFAPHYDDIEAFILQLEGSKRWKVYRPLSNETILPRTSSRDFVESDLTEAPVLDILLRPGDVLYMPRGWIHQAVTTSDEHSLHITISAMQQWSWGDLLELWLPDAVADAVAQNVSLRAGLPRNWLEYTGVMHDQHTIPEAMKQSIIVQQDARQVAFRAEAKQHLLKVVDHAMGLLDSTCDQMGKRFLSDRLPPAPRIAAAPTESTPLLPNTLCRIARPGIARLVIEASEESNKQQAVVYHCIDNSLVYHERALSPLEFELDDGPAIEQLLTTVAPYWISIMDLTHESIEDKVGVARALYEEGILSIRN